MTTLKEALAAIDAVHHGPCNEEGAVFREPWQAEAFAMTLALHQAKLFTWPEWASALAREIAPASADPDIHPGDRYYFHWLAALEKLVVEKGAASAELLATRKSAWDRAAQATPHGAPILLANDPQYGSVNPRI
jgi:nitrile hydratase accessory protein